MAAFRLDIIPVIDSMAALPWVPSRTLLFTPRGRFDLDFPADCPLLVNFIEFSHEYSLTPSYHEHLELSYIHSGCGHFTVEDRVYPVTAGDLVVVGAREFHLMEARQGHARVISVDFMPELVCASGGSSLEFEYLRPFYIRRGSFPNRVSAAGLAPCSPSATMLQIHEELHSGSRQSILAARTYLLNLLLALARIHGESGDGREDAGRRNRDTERLHEVFEFIRAHYREEIDLEQVARAARMSRSYFCRFFRKVTGNTLTGYVLRLRIDQAMRLLATTDQSVTEIAYESGFSSHSYFDRVFRRLAGQAPLQFRVSSGQFRASSGQRRDSRAKGRGTY
jgi:AraC-like DNA-binding protein